MRFRRNKKPVERIYTLYKIISGGNSINYFSVSVMENGLIMDDGWKRSNEKGIVDHLVDDKYILNKKSDIINTIPSAKITWCEGPTKEVRTPVNLTSLLKFEKEFEKASKKKLFMDQSKL